MMKWWDDVEYGARIEALYQRCLESDPLIH
jgi:hypothetical protein